MSNLRLVALGLGLAGRRLHLPAIDRIHDIEVVAAADPDPSTHPRNASFPVFADWEEALAIPADAVLIATPPDTHAKLALAALDAGRHLYLEKPMATSVEDASAIAQAAATAGRIVQLGFAYRFHPLWQRVRTRRQAGRLGAPLHAEAQFVSERQGSGWSAPVIDLACHHLDLLSWVLGALPAEVHALGGGRIATRWADGSTLSGHYSTGTPSDWVALDDGRGPITIDRARGSRLRGSLVRLGRDALPDLGLTVRHRVDPQWEGAFESALRAFGDAARGATSTIDGLTAGHPVAAGPLDGLYAVAAADAMLRSLQSGRPEPVTVAGTRA